MDNVVKYVRNRTGGGVDEGSNPYTGLADDSISVNRSNLELNQSSATSSQHATGTATDTPATTSNQIV